MPLLPQLIGGVQIRERRQRYAGEPRYKRLDFVRSKTTTNTDEWDLVRTTQPRYITVPVQYNVPVFQFPQVGYQPQYQAQQQHQYGWQQQQHYPQHQQHPHHDQHHDQMPIPPQHHGQQQLPFREQRLLEPAPHHHGIHDIIGHDSDDDIMYEYIEPRPKA